MKKTNSMQTPLAKVRGLGSAKSGLHHWWHQRLTAIAMVPLMIATLVIISQIGTLDYDGAMALMRLAQGHAPRLNDAAALVQADLAGKRQGLQPLGRQPSVVKAHELGDAVDVMLLRRGLVGPG